MARVRIHNFSISLDGFGAGEPQSLATPMGHAGTRLHTWAFATRRFSPDGQAGIDDVFAQRDGVGIGAEVMGSNKFGPPGWQDDLEWRGWWGEEPPFHTPVVVLTHRPRAPLTLGETTFTFLDAPLATALDVAAEAAGGLDVRLGGGASVVREGLAAGLVDSAHLVLSPILLGRGSRVWDGLAGLEERYAVESVASPSGVVHLLLERRSDA